MSLGTTKKILSAEIASPMEHQNVGDSPLKQIPWDVEKGIIKTPWLTQGRIGDGC
jgi:hypothetical protein